MRVIILFLKGEGWKGTHKVLWIYIHKATNAYTCRSFKGCKESPGDKDGIIIAIIIMEVLDCDLLFYLDYLWCQWVFCISLITKF